MPVIQYPFDKWAPDLGTIPAGKSGNLITAKNCLPSESGWRSMRNASAYTDAMTTGPYLGSQACTSSAGIYYLYAGSATKLYQLNALSWTDITRLSGGDYAVPSSNMWDFAQYGNTLIATNYADSVQSITLGGANFAKLVTGSVETDPKARYCAIVNDFLVLGNMNDSGGVNPFRVRWSAIGTIADFDESAITQADHQDLREFGAVTKIVGGEFGTIFQEKAVTRMTYIGPPVVWQFDQVEGARGTQAPRSVVRVGGMIYYWGQEGFYRYDGTQSTPVGFGTINRKVRDEMDKTYLWSMSATVDPQAHLIYWSYAGPDNSGGVHNRVVVYNYVSDRWSYIDSLTLRGMTTLFSTGYTIDDAIFDGGGSYGDLDQADFPSLDSDVWKGGGIPSIGYMNASNKLAIFNANDFATGEFETGDVSIGDGRRARVRMVRPIVSNPGLAAGVTITVEAGGRNSTVDAPVYSASASVTDVGSVPVRTNYRYHRIKTKITGDYENMSGLEITGEPEGYR